MTLSITRQGSAQFCTFHLSSFLFGVDVNRVREVIRTPMITRIPRTPQAIRGLINLRGEITPLIDMRHVLALDALPEESRTLTLVLRPTENEDVVGLLIDQVDEVLDINIHALETPPDTMDGLAKKWIRDVVKLETRLLLILNLDQLYKDSKGSLL